MALLLPEEDLTCTVCCDIFEDPVVLSCSHSVCEDCLKNYWATKESQECPLCRRRSSRDNPPICIALKNLCEAFTNQKKLFGELCPTHQERYKLFCKDDKELLCVVCRDSREHKTHECSPIDEAAADLKEEVEEELESLKDKLIDFKNMERTCHDMTEHIRKQAEETQSRIKEEFEKLHQFLRDEEEARLSALKEEEEEKKQMMKEKITDISKKISSLSARIKDIEEELQAEAVAFLSDFEDIMEKARREVKEPETNAGGLIDVAKHLGNLNFKVWLKMRDISHYSPVILDPNTAGDLLILSDDLTTIKDSYGRQNLPNNPERYWSCVLGSEGFDSGTFSWDVQVGKHKYWDIGVTTEPKAKDIWGTVWSLRSRTGLWTESGTHSVQTLGTGSPLTLSDPPETVRVDLNFDKGKLTFSDPLTETKLHTIKHNFTEKLFPFFHTYYQSGSMKIQPIKPTVVVDDDCELWIQF